MGPNCPFAQKQGFFTKAHKDTFAYRSCSILLNCLKDIHRENHEIYGSVILV